MRGHVYPSLPKVFITAVAAVGLLAQGARAEESASPANASEIGSVWWSEVVSADPARSRTFYSSVFGWVPKLVSAVDTSRPPKPGEPEYTIFRSGAEDVAGAAGPDGKEPVRPVWINYIQVANVDLAVMEAIKNGGRIVKAPYDDPNSGRFAIIQDPDGLSVGLVTPIDAPADR